MTPKETPFGKVVVFGAAGAMGEHMCHLLSGHSDALIAIDRRETKPCPKWRALVADAVAPPPAAADALAAADLVIVTLPEEVALAALATLTELIPEHALLVDTLSVKKPFADALAKFTPRFEALSINPMFAPSLGFSGQNVAVVALRPGPKSERFRRFIGKLGAHMTNLSADDHDRAMAALQTVTHATLLAFGLALKRLDYNIDALAPLASPPHRAMLTLLARILQGAPEVYWDIQAANPYAPEGRAALTSGLNRLASVVEAADTEAFRLLIDELREMLSSQQDTLADLCARTFELQRETNEE